jgi:predicted ATPase
MLGHDDSGGVRDVTEGKSSPAQRQGGERLADHIENCALRAGGAPSTTMLTRIELENFRSVGATTVLDLGALTVLVGRNAAGKSNVVDGLSFVADCAGEGLQDAVRARGGMRLLGRRGIGAVDTRLHAVLKGRTLEGEWDFAFRQNEPGLEISHETATQTLLDGLSSEARAELRRDLGPLTAEVIDRMFGGPLRFERRGQSWESPVGTSLVGDGIRRLPLGRATLVLPSDELGFEYKPLRKQLEGCWIVRPDVAVLRQRQDPDESRSMGEDGDNWCITLQNLRDDRQVAPDLIAALYRITGDVDDLRVQREGRFLNVQFHHREIDDWLDAEAESDGTLRAAALLAALLDPPATLLAIEEPELMVHPGALSLLLEFVREAARNTQVVLTTHSPDILDLVDADDVRIVDRGPGGTRVAPLDPDQRGSVREHLFGLGELMRREGLHSAAELAHD